MPPKGHPHQRVASSYPQQRNRPPSARVGSILSGRSSDSASSTCRSLPGESQWHDEAAGVGLTALGTFRSRTGFPILPLRQRAPDGASISGKRHGGKPALIPSQMRPAGTLHHETCPPDTDAVDHGVFQSSISRTSSSSIGRPSGRLATPSTTRPESISLPNTLSSSSDAPSATFGWSRKSPSVAM